MEQPEVNQNEILKHARRKLLDAANSIGAMRLSELQLPANSEWNVFTSFSFDLWLGKGFSVASLCCKRIRDTSLLGHVQFAGEATGNAYDKSLKTDSTLKLLEQQKMTWHKAECSCCLMCPGAFVHHNLWIKWAAQFFPSSDLKWILATLCNPLVTTKKRCAFSALSC